MALIWQLTGGVIEEAYVTVSPVSADETDFLTVNEGELISESGKILELLPVNAYTVRFVAGVQNSAAAFQVQSKSMILKQILSRCSALGLPTALSSLDFQDDEHPVSHQRTTTMPCTRAH